MDVKGFLAKIMKGRRIVQGRVSLGMNGGKKLLIGCSLYDELNPANNWLEGGVKASSYKAWLLGLLKIRIDYAGLVRTGVGWHRLKQTTED